MLTYLQAGGLEAVVTPGGLGSSVQGHSWILVAAWRGDPTGIDLCGPQGL